jgi:hypothetical protein
VSHEFLLKFRKVGWKDHLMLSLQMDEFVDADVGLYHLVGEAD